MSKRKTRMVIVNNGSVCWDIQFTRSDKDLERNKSEVIDEIIAKIQSYRDFLKPKASILGEEIR